MLDPTQSSRPIEAQLKSVSLEVLRTICLDPSTRVTRIAVKSLSFQRFASVKESTCYIVTIHTNNATLLRGDKELFKGSYKERLEGALDLFVKRHDSSASAHVEILGPTSSTLDCLVPIDKLVQAGTVTQDSPLASTAFAYQIPRALLRGRHLIGPSPALAYLCETLVQPRGGFQSLLDLFAGTGIATKVFFQIAKPRTALVVESDPAKIRHMRTYLQDPSIRFWQEDACAVKLPSSHFDIVIADPYYEDALTFLSAQLDWILKHAGLFLFVTGGVEHIQWNAIASRYIRGFGLRPKRHSIFGQTILEVRPSR